MNQSSQLAQATGSMGVVSALGISLQWGFALLEIAVTAEQAAALAILLFPIVHFAFLKLGAHMDAKEPQNRRNGEAKEPGK